MPLITIMCDVCKRPVTRVIQQILPELQEYLFTVFCHNKTDKCIFPFRLFEDGWQITEAVAFKQKEQPQAEVTQSILPEHYWKHSELSVHRRSGAANPPLALPKPVEEAHCPDPRHKLDFDGSPGRWVDNLGCSL